MPGRVFLRRQRLLLAQAIFELARFVVGALVLAHSAQGARNFAERQLLAGRQFDAVVIACVRLAHAGRNWRLSVFGFSLVLRRGRCAFPCVERNDIWRQKLMARRFGRRFLFSARNLR